jgi:hypothetical protein
VAARPGEYLCFFPNKKDDPRTSGGTDYPGSFGLRSGAQSGYHLTKQQFYAYLEENRQRQAIGFEPIMIVTKKVGPVTKARPFFSVGLRRLQQETALIVPAQFQLYLQGRGLVGPAQRLLLPAKIG